jgi:rubrerythrin
MQDDARVVPELPARPGRLQTIALTCSACGYGIARRMPPERCPMCQREATWIHRPWRPFTGQP